MVSWLDAPGSYAVMARWSRAAGLPRPMPDAAGLALRVADADGPRRPLDLPLTTSGRGRWWHHLPQRPGGGGGRRRSAAPRLQTLSRDGRGLATLGPAHPAERGSRRAGPGRGDVQPLPQFSPRPPLPGPHAHPACRRVRRFPGRRARPTAWLDPNMRSQDDPSVRRLGRRPCSPWPIRGRDRQGRLGTVASAALMVLAMAATFVTARMGVPACEGGASLRGPFPRRPTGAVPRARVGSLLASPSPMSPGADRTLAHAAARSSSEGLPRPRTGTPLLGACGDA